MVKKSQRIKIDVKIMSSKQKDKEKTSQPVDTQESQNKGSISLKIFHILNQHFVKNFTNLIKISKMLANIEASN